jgi:hypothetical protein
VDEVTDKERQEELIHWYRACLKGYPWHDDLVSWDVGHGATAYIPFSRFPEHPSNYMCLIIFTGACGAYSNYAEQKAAVSQVCCALKICLE